MDPSLAGSRNLRGLLVSLVCPAVWHSVIHDHSFHLFPTRVYTKTQKSKKTEQNKSRITYELTQSEPDLLPGQLQKYIFLWG